MRFPTPSNLRLLAASINEASHDTPFKCNLSLLRRRFIASVGRFTATLRQMPSYYVLPRSIIA